MGAEPATTRETRMKKSTPGGRGHSDHYYWPYGVFLASRGAQHSTLPGHRCRDLLSRRDALALIESGVGSHDPRGPNPRQPSSPCAVR